MFLETVTARRHILTLFTTRTKLFDDPPTGLLAAIAWEGDDDTATILVLWATPGARGDFALERVVDSFEDHELEGAEPQRLTPVHVHIRPTAPTPDLGVPQQPPTPVER